MHARVHMQGSILSLAWSAVEDLAQLLEVLAPGAAEHNTIQVGGAGFPCEALQYSIHQMGEGGWCVAESRRQDLELI